MIGVLLVDDQALFRKMLAIALGRQAGIAVLGQCADGTEVPAAAQRLRPDVVLMDLHMANTSGVQATRELLTAQPTACVIILTASPTKSAITEAADAGAAGYLHKGGDLEEVASAIRVVASGGAVWPHAHRTAGLGRAPNFEGVTAIVVQNVFRRSRVPIRTSPHGGGLGTGLL